MLRWTLTTGKVYRVQYKSATQRRVREAVMVFLSHSPRSNSTQWSARPAAGTQELPDEWVLRLEEVPTDTKRYMNRLV
jgi:hypothetical protein